MRIVKWENDPQSAVNGIAHVEVAPGEVADLDEMVRLVDGEVGNFGVSVRRVDAGPMDWLPGRKQERRVFRVFVHRD